MNFQRRRGDLVGEKSRVRQELEAVLAVKTETHYAEEDGILKQTITPLDIYKAVKQISYTNRLHGEFLLHLDDKLIEHNGWGPRFDDLEQSFEDLCRQRDETCPLKPLAEEMQTKLLDHLQAEDGEALVKSKQMEWIAEGEAQAERRLKRAATIVGITTASIGSFTAFVTWLIGMWG